MLYCFPKSQVKLSGGSINQDIRNTKLVTRSRCTFCCKNLSWLRHHQQVFYVLVVPLLACWVSWLLAYFSYSCRLYLQVDFQAGAHLRVHTLFFKCQCWYMVMLGLVFLLALVITLKLHCLMSWTFQYNVLVRIQSIWLVHEATSRDGVMAGLICW